jgi:hypothetical protein
MLSMVTRPSVHSNARLAVLRSKKIKLSTMLRSRKSTLKTHLPPRVLTVLEAETTVVMTIALNPSPIQKLRAKMMLTVMVI